MANYTEKKPTKMAWRANVRRIRTEAAIIMDEVLNTALAEANKQALVAEKRGEILRLEANPDELRRLLLSAAQRELGPGPDIDGTATEVTDAPAEA